MERIFELLDKIKDKYGVYIGNKSLYELSTFLSGYECAIYEITGRSVRFDSTFQLYVEIQFGEKYYGGKHWDGIFLEKYTQDEAFDQFYIYLKGFKKLYADANGQCLYELLSRKCVEIQSEADDTK